MQLATISLRRVVSVRRSPSLAIATPTGPFVSVPRSHVTWKNAPGLSRAAGLPTALHCPRIVVQILLQPTAT